MKLVSSGMGKYGMDPEIKVPDPFDATPPW